MTLGEILSALARDAGPGEVIVTHCGDQLGVQPVSASPSEMLELAGDCLDVPAHRIGRDIWVGTRFGWTLEFVVERPWP